MSGSGDGQRHHCPFAFLENLQTFSKDLNVRPKLLRNAAGAQDFGASVSRPRSASSETAVLGNSFLSFS
jgi:hypothetical protein